MKKITKLILTGTGAAALAAEIAIHGYMDVMYAERIPRGIIKRIADKKNDESMREFGAFTEKSHQWINMQDIEKIDLKSKHGYTVKGYLLTAQKPSNIFVIFAHGYRSDHMGDPANFERYYHEKGYNFLSVDHVTAGESGGDYVGFDYFESDDLLSWIDYLTERFGEDSKIILHGVSMGGATVCKCASRVPDCVKMIISDCAYTSATDQFTSVVNAIGIKKSAPAIIKLFNGLNKKFAGYDLKDTDVTESVRNARVPMLFVHGGADDFVPTDMVYTLYGICTAKKDLLIVDNAGHAQSIMVNGDLYKSKIDGFIAKYAQEIV